MAWVFLLVPMDLAETDPRLRHRPNDRIGQADGDVIRMEMDQGRSRRVTQQELDDARPLYSPGFLPAALDGKRRPIAKYPCGELQMIDLPIDYTHLAM